MLCVRLGGFPRSAIRSILQVDQHPRFVTASATSPKGVAVCVLTPFGFIATEMSYIVSKAERLQCIIIPVFAQTRRVIEPVVR